MRQAVVYEDTTRQGKNLCFVLQAAEGGGEDETVIIPLKFRTVFVTLLVKLFQPETFGRYEGIPIHGDNYEL